MKPSDEPFDRVFADVSSGNVKVPKSDYLSEGAFPVIDQGKSKIAGFTNDEGALFKRSNLPVIVFGDHTRCVKFVDHPFAMGADGVKVLKPQNGLDPKFTYHSLRNLRLADAGYDRHFKYLKRSSFPIVGNEMDQKRIAAILDKADAIRRKRQQALRLTDDFLRSVFLDMFGDPVTNPKGWKNQPLSDSLENIDSGWSPKCHSTPAPATEWGVLKLGAVTWCNYDETENKALPAEASPRPQHEVKPGDLLFCRKNTHQLVAAAAYVFETRPKLMLPDLIFRLRLIKDANLDPIFLWYLLNEPHQRKVIQSLAGGAAGSMPNISKAKLNQVNLIRPPSTLQENFASLVTKCRAKQLKDINQTRSSEDLFASLQQRAFKGEL